MGDIIITVNGKRVLSAKDLSAGIERTRELIIIRRLRYVNISPTKVIHEADDKTIQAEDRLDTTRITADSDYLLDASVANFSFIAEANEAIRPVKRLIGNHFNANATLERVWG